MAIAKETMQSIEKTLDKLDINELNIKEQILDDKINMLLQELNNLQKEKKEIQMYKIDKCEHKWERIPQFNERGYDKCKICNCISY